jgi:hypothetical protein
VCMYYNLDDTSFEACPIHSDQWSRFLGISLSISYFIYFESNNNECKLLNYAFAKYKAFIVGLRLAEEKR